MTMDHIIGTGVARLDALLGGGMPPGRSVMLYGGSFSGKELLARLALLEAMRRGHGAVLVLTNTTAEDALEELVEIAPPAKSAIEAGLLQVVDAYSRPIEADTPLPNVAYTDGPMDLNGLLVAAQRAQAHHLAAGRTHQVLVLDSLSTLIACSNPQTLFRFIQVFLGKVRKSGATPIILMDSGMHDDSDVQGFLHLMQGIVELRENGDRTQLRVQGFPVEENPGWVDYEHARHRFQVTGSLAAGRIR